jgi:hypothetical protein
MAPGGGLHMHGCSNVEAEQRPAHGESQVPCLAGRPALPSCSRGYPRRCRWGGCLCPEAVVSCRVVGAAVMTASPEEQPCRDHRTRCSFWAKAMARPGWPSRSRSWHCDSKSGSPRAMLLSPKRSPATGRPNKKRDRRAARSGRVPVGESIARRPASSNLPPAQRPAAQGRASGQSLRVRPRRALHSRQDAS